MSSCINGRPKTTESISIKFCTVIKTTKRPSWVVRARASQIQDGSRLPSWITKNRFIAVTVLLITAKFGTMTHFDQLHRMDRYSADWAKIYRISHNILADHNRKRPKENISAYTDIIIGNSNVLLWPPSVADADIIFLPGGFFFLSFFSRLISAVVNWMSAILAHMVWP